MLILAGLLFAVAVDGEQDHGTEARHHPQDDAGGQELPLVQEDVTQAHGEEVVPECQQRRPAQANGDEAFR